VDVAEVFDDWAARGRADGMEQGHLQTAGAALAALQLGPGRRFLDVGTGNGWAVRHARRHGAEAVGIDVSPGMLREAARRAIPVARADAAALPFPDAAFDAAWSMEALYYAPDPDTVLREVHRVLRPRGTFDLVIDHYAENPASHAWGPGMGLDLVLRSEREWSDALQDAGFRDVRATRLRADGPGVETWKREQGTLWIRGHAGPPGTPRNPGRQPETAKNRP